MSDLNHPRAENVLRLARMGHQRVSVPFVAPIMSAMLGAAAIHDARIRSDRFLFIGGAESYVRNNGLRDAMDGKPLAMRPSGLQGKTYTRLTKLATHDDVDVCNAVTNSLIREQLAGHTKSVVSRLCHVVGELHDNVASHARGGGYSCVQMYPSKARKEVQFAVADAGCGMLFNVKRRDSSITTDHDAIGWCLQEGHTTGSPSEDWAQRLPEDACCSPYPESTSVRINDNHHLGLGLGHLVRLVNETGGEAWILSGKGECTLGRKGPRFGPSKTEWQGVAIEFSIPVVATEIIEPKHDQILDDLAGRLGI